MDKKSTEEISLKELIIKANEWFLYLISQWKIVLVAVVMGSIIGVTYSIIKKPVYTATLSFALEGENSGGGLGAALGLAGTLGIDLGGSGGGMFEGSNLTELLKSRTIVEKTLLEPVYVNGKLLSLAEMFIQNNNWRDKWNGKKELEKAQFLPHSNRNNFNRVQDSILGLIYYKLSQTGFTVAQKDKKIAIINVEVKSTSELFAKYFSESLVGVVSQFYVQTKSKKAKENMLILQSQTDSVRKALNVAITGVAIANDNTFNLNPALNVRRTPSARRQVDVQANTAILTELVKQSEIAKVTLRRETPLIQIIDSPILPLSKEKVGLVKGILLGGFLSLFLTILFFSFKFYLKKIEF